MNIEPTQCRQIKKRRFAELMEAAQRNDAMLPRVLSNDLPFTQLILFTYIFREADGVTADNRKRLLETFRPEQKLRADDISFIEEKLAELRLSTRHCRWLCALISSSFPANGIDDTVSKLETFAITDEQSDERKQKIMGFFSNMGWSPSSS